MISSPTRHSPGELIAQQQPIPANILLVDDRPETREVLARMLTDPGLKLVQVRTGQAALNWLAENQDCALILIAAKTAHPDGFELAWLIKENPITRPISLIFLAQASLSQTETATGYALGAIDFLVEPFEQNVVINKVRMLVELYRKNIQLDDTTTRLQIQNKRYEELCQAFSATQQLESQVEPWMIQLLQKLAGQFISGEHSFATRNGHAVETLPVVTAEIELPGQVNGNKRHFNGVTPYKPAKHDLGELNELFEERAQTSITHRATTNIHLANEIVEAMLAEERFRRVIEAAATGLVLVTQTGQIVLMNSRAEELFGYHRDELMGKAIEKLIPARFHSKHPSQRDAFIANPQIRIMGRYRDVTAHRKDGAEFPVEVRLSPIQMPEELMVLATIVDITERKRAEAEIRSLNESLEERVRKRTAQLEMAITALQKEKSATNRLYRQTEALRKAALVLISTVDLNQVIHRILTELQDVVPYDSASVQLVCGDYAEILALRGVPDPANYVGARFLVKGDTPNAHVLCFRQPLIIDDVQAQPAFNFQVSTEAEARIRSWLGVPMLIGGQIIGMLTLDKQQSAFYQENHTTLALAYAAQAAIAIENARLYQQVQHELKERQKAETELARERASLAQRVNTRTAELTEAYQVLRESQHRTKILYQVSRALVESRALADLLQTAVNMVAETLPAEQVLLCLVDLPEQRVTHFVKSGRDPGQIEKISFEELWAGLSGWALRELKTAVSSAGSADMRESAAVQQQRMQHRGEHLVAAPLLHQGKVLGTLTVIKAGAELHFTSDEVRLLESIADQIALGINDARLKDSLERRTTELSLANAELARVARLKDEFLANTSHELRTPLNAILGLSEVLRTHVYGPLNEEQSRALHHIEDSGQHLLALITDILDLSKIEAGKMQLDMGLMTLEDVCQASLQFINQLAGKKQIKVLFTFDEQVRIIQGDERRLKQILVNLLSNAVKFTPEGGQVALEVQGDQAQGLIRFVIRDTGIGIDTKTIPHLFKPFVQADSSLSREHEGTGLGLALVYRLTKLHDGSITVESELGQGSQFTITLPWIAYNFNDQAAKTGLEPLSAEEIHSYLLQQYSEDSPPLVLVVEDNQANLMALVDFLKTLNFRVKVAQNGLEGLELAKAYHPDLILMDIQMPGMDGLEATRRIRAVTELKSVPIIALTALTMPGDRERCLAAGITDYISKPVKLKQLGEIICSHLSGSGAAEKQTE